MKKSKVVLITIISLLLLTGCNDNSNNTNTDTYMKYDVTGFNHTTCTRDAYTEDIETTVEINYDLYSDSEGYLKILKSKEEITSSNMDTLTEYEEAYKNIYKVYENVEYYDNEVIRTDNKVTSTTIINYEKVDMDKVLEIEGEEDNVKVEDGKIKLSDWKSFAKTYGTTCD